MKPIPKGWVFSLVILVAQFDGCVKVMRGTGRSREVFGGPKRCGKVDGDTVGSCYVYEDREGRGKVLV